MWQLYQFKQPAGCIICLEGLWINTFFLFWNVVSMWNWEILVDVICFQCSLKLTLNLFFSKYILLVLLWRIYPCMFFLDCNFQSECHNSTFCPLSNHFVCLNSTSFLIDCKLAFRSASIQSTTDGLESLPCIFFFSVISFTQMYMAIHKKRFVTISFTSWL